MLFALLFPTPPVAVDIVSGFGLFSAGSGSGTVFDKYVFSTGVTTAGITIGLSNYDHTAVGNRSKGIFGGGQSGGQNKADTRFYTYSNDTIAAGTSLGQSRYSPFGMGCSTVGLFSGGWTSTGRSNFVDKYTYSTMARTTAAALAIAVESPSGFGIEEARCL